jgi:mycofactocin glycosyltransferase
VARPSVDVVVPFRGGAADLEELRARLGRLELLPGDSLLVVDNTPGRGSPRSHEEGRAPVLHAAERGTPGFARNRGVARGRAEWLVFFDADVVPPPDLLDRYFDPPAGERIALLAGGVVDEPVPPDAPPAARYAHLRELMSQDNTYRFGSWSFPQTANAACRRAAFEAVGGFREDIRAAEDADLSYRLRAAGWEVERRESAAVVHLNRQSVRGFVAQRLLHGAGAAWLAAEYPGSFPPRRRPGLVWWGVRTAAKGLVSAARTRDRDRALWAVFEPLEFIMREFGRSLPNERPLGRRRSRGTAARYR